MDAKLFDEVVRRILTVRRPERIILFGSAGMGQATKDSDIDLLVLERDVRDPRGASLTIRGALSGMGASFDVIVMDIERFQETKDVIGGIAYPADRYGRVLYEAA